MLAPPCHGTTGVNYITFKRNNSETVLTACCHFVGSFKVTSKHDITEQAAYYIPISRFITDKLGSDPNETIGLLHQTFVGWRNLPRSDNIQRQESCSTELTLLQEGYRLTGYRFILHNDMLHGSA
ncbi:hypothetical protein D3C81_1026460 [compost metagenome]